MEENKQTQTPPLDPSVLKSRLTPIPKSNAPSIFAMIIALFCFATGGGQILLSLSLVFFALPQLINLQRTIEDTALSYLPYLVLALSMFFGFINIYFGLRIFKKANPAFAILFLIISILIQGFFIGMMVVSIINPIYKTVSEVSIEEYETETPPKINRSVPGTHYDRSGRFSFTYPREFTVREQFGGSETNIYYYYLNNKNNQLRIEAGPITNAVWYEDQKKDTEVINGVNWTKIPFSKYCEGNKCGNIPPGFYINRGEYYIAALDMENETVSPVIKQIVESLVFIEPTPSCMKRPACLDSEPRCMIPEPAEGWCP